MICSVIFVLIITSYYCAKKDGVTKKFLYSKD